MADLTTAWAILQVSTRASQYGGTYEQITFANMNGEIAHTYADPNNGNYARWARLIQAYNEGMGVVVSGLVFKKNGFHNKTKEPLINADSPVKVVHVEEDIQTIFREFAREFDIPG